MSRPFHLVQVCNVGTITGGTGACAGTIMQALPDWNHTLLSFGRLTEEMLEYCRPHRARQVSRVTGQLLDNLFPDFMVYHNTRRDRVADECLHWPAIYYRHSRGSRWADIKTVACSGWAARQQEGANECDVLYQAVARPARSRDGRRRAPLGRELTIGRLCTPVERKWPQELIPFYTELGGRHPSVSWEFVGCPSAMQADLRQAVRGRAVFHEASWSARCHFWNWDASLYHHPTMTESFGRTMAEAMRTGCIPITDDRGGFREQIAGGTGYLCGSIEEFSKAVDSLSDPAIRMQRSRRCRAHADDRFSIGVFRERLLQIVRDVIT